MKKTLTAILLSLTLLVFGCGESSVYPDAVVERRGVTYLINSTTPFSGEIVTLYPGLSDAKFGQTRFKIQYKNGKKNGEGVEFHGNGQLKAEGDYKNGEKDGPWVEYDRNGQLEEKGTFKNGKKDGLWVAYHDNGQIYEKGTYKNGKEEGVWVAYNSNGTVWTPNTLNNLSLIASGQSPETPARLGTYKNGKLLGDFQKGLTAFKSGDYATARHEWGLIAETGDARAQYNLGLMSYKGQGVYQNYIEAERWFTRAAEQGDARAQYNLGVMYEHGVGTPLDREVATQWYQLAAKQGHAGAEKQLGPMFKDGIFVGETESHRQEVPRDAKSRMKNITEELDRLLSQGSGTR